MKKLFLPLSMILALLVINCSNESAIIEDEVSIENQDAIEAQYIIPISKNNSTERAPCDICTTKPGDISKFNSALRDSKVQRYTNGGSTKKEYKKAESYCNTDFFNTCWGFMVLKTTNQKNDRVELRQEKNLSLNDQSILRFQAQLQQLPRSSSSKGITIAQIHNDASGVKRPLLRLEYTGNNKLRTVVTDTYVKDQGTVIKDYMVDFEDGDYVYSKVEIKSSGNKINIYVKNVTTGQSKSKTYTVSNKWRQKDGQFYFKTGAYLQVSGSTPRVSYNRFQYFY